MDQFVNNLFSNGISSDFVVGVSEYCVNIALLFMPVAFALRLGIAYVASIMSFTGLDIKKILGESAGIGLLWMLLWVYSPSVSIVKDTMLAMKNGFSTNELTMAADKYRTAKAESMEAKTKEMEEAFSTIDLSKTNGTNEFDGWIDGIVLTAVEGVCYILSFVVGVVISIFAYVLVQFLIMVGPLAIMFTAFGFKSQFAKWFGALINTLSLFIVVTLLEGLLGALTVNVDIISSQEAFVGILWSLAQIALFLSAFKLSSYIVGEDAGSSLANNFIQAANTAANWAGSAMKLGGSGSSLNLPGGNSGSGGSAGSNIGAMSKSFSETTTE